VTILFGVYLELWLFYLVLFCNVWVCVCVGFVMWVCVCVGGFCNVW